MYSAEKSAKYGLFCISKGIFYQISIALNFIILPKLGILTRAC